MKKSFVVMLCTCSVVYAESRVLPPVVDNSTYAGGSTYNSAAPSANAMYEVIGRLEQLQAEVQQLRGLVEEQSQTIVDLQQRQSNIYLDLDQRMQTLSGVNPESIVQQIPENSVQNRQMTAPTVNNLAVDPKQIQVIPPVGSTAIAPPGSVNASEETENTAQIPVVEPEPAKTEKQIYQAAYETLRNGHNTKAIAEFKMLLANFPEGEYADNSQYWLAEAYKVNQDLNASKAAFIKVVEQYQNSPKVPDALLKLGYIEFEQKNKAKARDYLMQVTVNHPGTTAAHLATKKLMQMGVMQP